MSKPSEFVDALMLNTLAQRLNHDIVLVHMNREILESIKQEGGFDVAEFLEFEDDFGEFNTVLLRSIDFILSFNEFSFFIVVNHT